MRYIQSAYKLAALLILLSTISACTGLPKNVQPVHDFEIERYLGQWYEVARLDHSFERGLSRVTANYSMRDDGGVRVINRGYSEEDKAWDEAEGKAYFVEAPTDAYLKVSFFGPFYGAYVVFELDKVDYQYAFVSGPSTEYLWLLARSPEVPQSLIDQFKDKAASIGFDTDQLIFVDHSS